MPGRAPTSVLGDGVEDWGIAAFTAAAGAAHKTANVPSAEDRKFDVCANDRTSAVTLQ